MNPAFHCFEHANKAIRRTVSIVLTQLRLILFIYWSLPLLIDKLLNHSLDDHQCVDSHLPTASFLWLRTLSLSYGSLFSRFRVQIAAAIAKAAAAVPDSTNDGPYGIPTFVVWDRGRKPLTNSAPEDDLPLYHIPCT